MQNLILFIGLPFIVPECNVYKNVGSFIGVSISYLYTLHGYIYIHCMSMTRRRQLLKFFLKLLFCFKPVLGHYFTKGCSHSLLSI